MFGNKPSQSKAEKGGKSSSSGHSSYVDLGAVDQQLQKRQFQLPEKFFDKVLEIERQIDEMKESTPHDLLQTLMSLYSDAIEYYGANDDHEMCIDLNMRMQSVLVRPYILDCLCEHNQLTTSQTENFKGKLYGKDEPDAQKSRDLNESLPDGEDDEGSVDYGDIKTNFESDKRRKSNPFKKMFKKKKSIKSNSGSATKNDNDSQSGRDNQIDSSSTAKSTSNNSLQPPLQSQNSQVQKPPIGIISQQSSPGVRENNPALQKKGTMGNERLINLLASKQNKTKEQVMNELDKYGQDSDKSSEYDDMDMTHYEDDIPVNKEEEIKPKAPYRGYRDQHDYGQSDNEEQWQKRSKSQQKNKNNLEKAAFYESDSTVDLSNDHTNIKKGKTMQKQNVRYALNRQVVHVRFRIYNPAYIAINHEGIDDSIVFNKVTKDGNNFKKYETSKKKAQLIIQNYMAEHKFEIQEKIKERKIARLKNQAAKRRNSRQLNPNLTGTATILNKGDTSNIMENPVESEDNDEFDYVQVDNDSNLNDVSQTDIMALTQAMGAQAKQGKPVYERKQGAKAGQNALRKGGYANSVLTNNLQSTGSSSQPLTQSPVKQLKAAAVSDQQSQLLGISPLQVGKRTSQKLTASAQNAKQGSGGASGEGGQANAGSGSFLQSKSGGSNLGILRVQGCEDLDNPDEMNKMEDRDGAFSEDDDPEQLEELERRKEEIEENFTERSVQMKHDLIEKLTKDIEDQFDSDQEDEMDEKLDEEIKKVSKQLDKKRQENKLALRKMLNEIIQDQEATLESKLQRLYDQTELNLFTDSLLKE